MNVSAQPKPLIVYFKDIDKDDIPLVGGKGANLGEMTRASFPVPNGFAVTVAAYDLFLTRSDILNKINAILKETDVNDSSSLENASKQIQKLIVKSEIPPEVSYEVIKAYKKLSGKYLKVNQEADF